MSDLSDVRFVKRIVVGNDDPSRMRTEKEIQKAVDLLNRSLKNDAGGTILGVEKCFAVLSTGGDQVVLQWLVYHVGFARKPYWLDRD